MQKAQKAHTKPSGPRVPEFELILILFLSLRTLLLQFLSPLLPDTPTPKEPSWSNVFLVELSPMRILILASLGFSVYNIMSSANRDHLLLPYTNVLYSSVYVLVLWKVRNRGISKVLVPALP